MKSIYASKLYKASKHKDKIHSAINDPMNVELVQQLKEYLDEPEEAEVETNVPEVSEVENKSNSENRSTRENKSSDVSVTKSSSPTSTSPSLGDNDKAESDKESSESKEEKPVKEASEDNKQDATELKKSRSFHSPKKSESKDETSTETESKVEESVTVESATVLYQQPIQAGHCCHGDFIDPDAIKGTLNVREDTKGVSRIFIKDDELWIHYQDKINLNSVMEPVIAVLNGTGFTNLEFNRLARTENAIVFQISCVFNQIEPMKVEDEQK